MKEKNQIPMHVLGELVYSPNRSKKIIHTAIQVDDILILSSSAKKICIYYEVALY